MASDAAIETLVRRFEQRAPLGPGDRDAVAALAVSTRSCEPGGYLIREDMPLKPTCAFVLSGVAVRHKLTPDGARQIVSIQMRGDFVDLQHPLLRTCDFNVQAITRLEVAEVERERLRSLASSHPALGDALWTEAQADASTMREWMTNLGRRDARTRLLHLLCEYAARAGAAGLADAADLPMTQEQLGDATALTAVHVNRTLRALEADGLIARSKRVIRLVNAQRAAKVASFNPRYLYLAER